MEESQGSGYVILNYCRGLRELGHTVDLLGPRDLERFFPGRRAKRYRQSLGMLTCALGHLQRKSYDVIEIYGGEGWLLARLLAARKRRNFLIVSHSNGLEAFAHQQLGGKSSDSRWNMIAWMTSGFRAVDRIVTVSEADRQYALAEGYQAANHVLAIENPLPEVFLAQEPGFDGRPNRIGFCGSWLPRKGVPMLSRDLSRLLQDHPQWTLRLIGVGAEFRIGDHFPEGIADRVEVIPFVSDKAVLKALYNECAIVVVPSIYESFGLVTAEAMACGCAVVATRTGFAASLRDGDESILMATSASPSLYEGAKRLMDDPALRVKVARGGHRRVQSLRWKEAANRLAEFYQAGVDELQGHPAKAAA